MACITWQVIWHVGVIHGYTGCAYSNRECPAKISWNGGIKILSRGIINSSQRHLRANQLREKKNLVVLVCQLVPKYFHGQVYIQGSRGFFFWFNFHLSKSQSMVLLLVNYSYSKKWSIIQSQFNIFLQFMSSKI